MFSSDGSVLLYLLAGYAARVVSSKWRICYLIPSVICLPVTAFAGFERDMIPVYIGSVVCLAGFFKTDAKSRRRASLVAGLCVAIAIPACALDSGYRSPDYVKDFETGFAAMRAHYVMAEQKGIDWDALYEEYLPQFQAVDKAHDAVANCVTWYRFCQAFHDGHVAFSPTQEETEKLAEQSVCGNDYGLAPEGEHTYCYEGVWDETTASYLTDETGNYVCGKALTYTGENLFDGGSITILVNAQCISAGDHFAQMMSGFDNVTIMGFTKSNGSAQAVGSQVLQSGVLAYSMIPTLNEDGSMFVDSDTSRENPIALDVRIPFDETAVKVLFEDGEDYLLQQAVR